MNKSAASQTTTAGPGVTPRRKPSDRALFQAGERVPPGLYRQVEGARRQVRLTHDDILPASLDGRVALCERVCSWGEVKAW
ncbi:MAG: hypothetical protein V4671_08410 [Armatimonadota bacterium]